MADPSTDASSLASSLAEALGADDPPETATPTPEAPEAPGVEAAPESPSGEGRVRDSQGRFTAKSGKDDPPSQEAAAQPPSAATTEPVTAGTPEVKPAEPTKPDPLDIAPDTWSAEGKSIWKDLPPPARKEVLRREQNMRDGLFEYRQGHQIATNLAQACAPYVPQIQAAGSTLMQAIPYALQKIYEANTNPVGVIMSLAQSAGIDLAQLAQQAPQQQSSPELLQLRQQVAQLTNHIQGSAQQGQQAQEQDALNVIAQFRADPTNTYFSNVEADVLDLLRSGRNLGSTPVERLKNAYAQACRLNPEVSAAIDAKQRQEADAKRLKEAQAKAASAKRAGFDVAGSGALAGKASRDLSIEDSLRANLGL